MKKFYLDDVVDHYLCKLAAKSGSHLFVCAGIKDYLKEQKIEYIEWKNIQDDVGTVIIREELARLANNHQGFKSKPFFASDITRLFKERGSYVAYKEKQKRDKENEKKMKRRKYDIAFIGLIIALLGLLLKML